MIQSRCLQLIHGASLVNPPAAIAGHLERLSSPGRPVSEECTHLRSVLLNLALMTGKLLAAKDLFNGTAYYFPTSYVALSFS